MKHSPWKGSENLGEKIIPGCSYRGMSMLIRAAFCVLMLWTQYYRKEKLCQGFER